MKQHFTRLTCYLCLLLISTVPIGRTYAKYATTASSGENSARVAAWVVNVTSNTTGALTVDASETNKDTYSFTVSNANSAGKICEVDYSYKIIVESASLSNLTIELKKDNGTALTPKTISSNKYTFESNDYKFTAGVKGVHSFTLTLSNYSGSEEVENAQVKVYVEATQTD